MKNYKIFLAAILAACLAISCKKTVEPSANSTVALSSEQTLIDNKAETLPPIQTPVSVNVNSNIGGFLEGLPAGYLTHPHKKYPLIIFIHGIGELGNGTTDLYKVAANSIPRLIKYGTFPANFVVDKHNYSFIVVSPQFKAWPSPADVNTMLNYAIAHYHIDTTKMYLAGLSMGGGVVEETGASTYGNRFAALVPMAGASYPTTQKAQVIVNNKLAMWAFHNNDDGTVPPSYSINYVSYINALSPLYPAKLTLWPTGGHDCWSKASNPDYRENGKDIYEFMLSYSKP